MKLSRSTMFALALVSCAASPAFAAESASAGASAAHASVVPAKLGTVNRTSATNDRKNKLEGGPGLAIVGIGAAAAVGFAIYKGVDGNDNDREYQPIGSDNPASPG